MEETLNLQEFMKGTIRGGPEVRPRTVYDTGVRQAVLEDLALKTLYLAGQITVLELADHIKLSYEVATELFHRLRSEILCQVNGMVGNVPQISITSQGRTRAIELLAHSHYTGAAPVPLETYVEQVRKQSVGNVRVHPGDVERAFAHLVIDEKMMWQFGTALNSGSSVFLYGPPGVGKTTVAETLSRVLAENDVWIPYALEVDGQIIQVYDPVIHKIVERQKNINQDERWIRCRRPTVMVGGELTVDMLDLQFNPISKFYVAPAQMKANNGVLIIDDFGRQRIRPDELLNRWVVPLDRRIDFLSMAGGRKIEIPFEMLVVFASNMDPAQLVDAAFLRRIQTKIKMGEISDKQFREIFRRVAADRNIENNEAICNELIRFIRVFLKQELRSCYPRDIINQVCWAAQYEDRAPVLDHISLMRAVDAYFLQQ